MLGVGAFGKVRHTKLGNFGILLQEPLFDNGIALAVALGNQTQLVKLLLPLVGLVVEQNIPLHVVIGEATVALLLVVAADGAGHYMETLIVPAGRLQKFVFLGADNFSEAVRWAVECGITKGTGGSRFSPYATCTRAQIVTFLYRAAGSPAVSSGSRFFDVAPNAFYRDAVAWATERGITKGTSDTTFSPDATCTRAEVVTLLYRLLK